MARRLGFGAFRFISISGEQTAKKPLLIIVEAIIDPLQNEKSPFGTP